MCNGIVNFSCEFCKWKGGEPCKTCGLNINNEKTSPRKLRDVISKLFKRKKIRQLKLLKSNKVS